MRKPTSKFKGTALVTGGAKRIGRAIAIGLARDGYRIALHYHASTAEAHHTAAAISDAGGACGLFKADLTKAGETADLIRQVKKRFSDLNILVNNASIYKKSRLISASLEDFEANFQVHVKAPFILTQCFAKAVRKGGIINILDTKIVGNHTEFATYLLSKKCLGSLSAMSALELAPGIRVNAVAPGPILPPPGKGVGFLKKRARLVPLRRPGDPRQIAEAVVFLANNPFITGETIFVDGGEHLIRL